MKNRIISVALALVLLGGAVACSSSDKEDKPVDPPTTVTTEAPTTTVQRPTATAQSPESAKVEDVLDNVWATSTSSDRIAMCNEWNTDDEAALDSFMSGFMSTYDGDISATTVRSTAKAFFDEHCSGKTNA